MRRRRLDAFRDETDWPGKAVVRAREEAQYDHCLVVVALMLELPVPEQEPGPGNPCRQRLAALWKDRLAAAGLDVFSPRRSLDDGILDDGDPVF